MTTPEHELRQLNKAARDKTNDLLVAAKNLNAATAALATFIEAAADFEPTDRATLAADSLQLAKAAAKAGYEAHRTASDAHAATAQAADMARAAYDLAVLATPQARTVPEAATKLREMANRLAIVTSGAIQHAPTADTAALERLELAIIEAADQMRAQVRIVETAAKRCTMDTIHAIHQARPTAKQPDNWPNWGAEDPPE